MKKNASHPRQVPVCTELRFPVFQETDTDDKALRKHAQIWVGGGGEGGGSKKEPKF